jgi:competence CoiA-like predicted nuclease
LVGKEQQSDFICLGCDNILIAKVNGKIKQPHFAHKSIQECNGETYLHRLGKQVFFEVYQKCLEENEPFILLFMFLRNAINSEEVFVRIVILDLLKRSLI